MGSVKERLIQFVDSKGISRRKFADSVNTSPNILSTASAIGSNILVQISNKYPELNMDWVITGRGIMLRSGVNAHNKTDEINKQSVSENEGPLRIFMEDDAAYTKTRSIGTLPLFNEAPAATLQVMATNDTDLNQQLLVSNHLFLKTLLYEQAEASAQQLGITVEEAQQRLAEKLKQAAAIPLPDTKNDLK